MKHLSLFSCLLLFNSILSAQAVIVINEIRASDDHVELKNIGNATANISAWWLCQFPNYNQLSTLTVACGSLTSLAPGALVQVDMTVNVAGTDGELALYVNSSFDNPSSIRDYVEWGSHGHTRSSVAEAAGIWADGDFVPAWGSAQSLEYDGSGNESCNWEPENSASMPCIENTTSDCLTMPIELLDFHVSQIDNGASIQWKAIYDQNVSRVDLQYSADESSWKNLNAWPSIGPEFYEADYVHRNLPAGMHYYRLVTIYKDGSTENSPIATLRMCYDSNKAIIWPNPTHGTIEVLVESVHPEGFIEYQVRDAQGRLCLRQEGSERITLRLDHEAEGVYFIHIPALGIVHRVIRTR